MMGSASYIRRLCAVFLATLALGVAAPALGRKGPEKSELLQQGQAALQDELYDLAEKKFREYMRASRQKKYKALGAIYLAEALFCQGKYDETLETLADYGEEAGAVYWQARAQHARGEETEALARLDEFNARFSDDTYQVPVRRLRARILLALGRRDEALRVFKDVHQQHEDHLLAPDNLLEWAGVLIEMDEEKEAVRLLERITANYPASTAAHHARLWLARMALDEQAWPAAEALLQPLTLEAVQVPDAIRREGWLQLAAAQQGQTNWQGALRALDEVRQLSRRAEEQHAADLGRGLMLVRTGARTNGMQLVQRSIIALTNRAVAAEGQLALGRILLEQEAYEDAERAYRHYLEAFFGQPGDGDAYMGKGWSLWALGRYGEAAAAFERAHASLAEQSAREEALFKAADAYFANEQYATAAGLYARLLELFPGSERAVQAKFQQAECLARTGKSPEAEAVLLDLVRDHAASPLAAQAALRVGMLKEAASQWDQAIARYEGVLADFPKSDVYPMALHRRGLMRYRLGEFKEALGDFESVTTRFPAAPVQEQAFYMRGWCLYLMGESKEALRICTEFVERYPSSVWSPDVLFWLGEYQYNHGKYAEAEARFAALAENYGSSPLADDALYWAGRAAAAQKEYLRAIEHFTLLTRAHARSHLLAETRFAQGDALSELGEFASAILAYEEVIKSSPGSYLVHLAWGRIGDCQFTLGADDPSRYQKAVAAYGTVLNAPAAGRELQMQAEYKLARCFEKQGNADQALEHYMNVVYRYFEERAQGARVQALWFTRAAFAAAALKESREEWGQALRIYERVVEAGVPAASDAQARIQKLRMEHWLPLLRDHAGAS